MPTYKQIQNHVRSTRGFVPKTCWIAHIKSDFGLTERQAPNRADPKSRIHHCPPDKRAALEAGMLELGALN